MNSILNCRVLQYSLEKWNSDISFDETLKNIANETFAFLRHVVTVIELNVISFLFWFF